MRNPLVSICLPTCNRAGLLRESLGTICGQGFEPLEILISDDASTDETEKLCRDLADRDPRVRYIRHPKRLGLYPNHNFCINESRGEFLCLLHDDDQHHPELISESVAFLLRHPEVGIVCSDWDLLDDDGRQVGVRDHDVPDVVSGLDYISRTMRSGQSWIGCPGAVIRRSALGAARFREDGPIGFADFVVWFQIAERFSIGHISRRLWRYRLHGRSFSRRTIESLTRDYYENLNQYCDDHLARRPDHADLVRRWRRDINHYLFWALSFELGLHYRQAQDRERRPSVHQSVFEISGYRLTPEEVRSVRAQLRRFRTGPTQVLTFWILEAMQGLGLTGPLAGITYHAAKIRRVLGLKGARGRRPRETEYCMDRIDELQRATQRSFGYQWTQFADMVAANREHFLRYIAPVEPSFFKGKLGLDAACGFGRHLYYAREFGARMVGIDFSDAIRSARKVVGDQPGASLVKGDLYRLPFRPESFDFVYCLGALHHLPDPEAGFQSLLPCVKKNGAVFIWVYSKKRWVLNTLLETVRLVTARLPMWLLIRVSAALAILDYFGFINPYRILAPRLSRWGFTLWAPPRICLYAKFPFRVCHADWFDRLAAPIRFYYDEKDLEGWAARARLRDVQVSATGAYGLRLFGYKPG